MDYIKLFEAYDDSITGIVKFVRNLNNSDSAVFFSALESISKEYDIGISNIEGSYVRANIAKKLDTKDTCITFWFSLETGIEIVTKNEKPVTIRDSWFISSEVKNFIENNAIFSSNTLRGLRLDNYWDKSDFMKIVESDFALIINIDKCKKGLKDLKRKRSEEKLPRINDKYYRTLNKNRWNDKLNRNNLLSNKYNDDRLRNLLYKIDLMGNSSFGKDAILDKVLSLYHEGGLEYSDFMRIIRRFT